MNNPAYPPTPREGRGHLLFPASRHCDGKNPACEPKPNNNIHSGSDEKIIVVIMVVLIIRTGTADMMIVLNSTSSNGDGKNNHMAVMMKLLENYHVHKQQP